jgi:NADPH-dependent 7-cyano-7-deazaguanine reductase QueF
MPLAIAIKLKSIAEYFTSYAERYEFQSTVWINEVEASHPAISLVLYQ